MLMGEYDYEMDIKVQREEAAAEANKRAAEAEERADKAELALKEKEKKDKEDTVRRMLEIGGFDTKTIAQVTGLTMEEVQNVK